MAIALANIAIAEMYVHDVDSRSRAVCRSVAAGERPAARRTFGGMRDRDAVLACAVTRDRHELWSASARFCGKALIVGDPDHPMHGPGGPAVGPRIGSGWDAPIGDLLAEAKRAPFVQAASGLVLVLNVVWFAIGFELFVLRPGKVKRMLVLALRPPATARAARWCAA